MQDAFSSLFPVVTLLLGACLSNFLKLSELRRTMRLDAADQLAEPPAHLWNKTDPDAWIRLSTALSRLSIRLDLAGVDPELSERVRSGAVAFWRTVKVVAKTTKATSGGAGQESDETWTEASAIVRSSWGRTTGQGVGGSPDGLASN